MNDEMQDFKLNASEGTEPVESGGKKPFWLILLIALAIVGVLIFFLRSRDESEPEAEPTAEAPSAQTSVEQDSEQTEVIIGEVPSLQESDPWLRDIVRQLSTHPDLASWLLSEEMVRTFVVVVDNIAEGTPPSSHLEFLAPEEGFQVRESAGKTTIDPASYRRYNGMVDVIESIDTAGAGELYRAVQPLLQDAYENLGYPGQSFDVALGRAIQRLLAVPVIEEPIEVDAGISAYKFHDQNLEELSPVAKQFLRMGPNNLERLQAKARELARACGVSAG